MSIETASHKLFKEKLDDLITGQVRLLEEDDELSQLVQCLVSDPEIPCSVEIINDSCQIYQYYCEETTAGVEAHFNRALEGAHNRTTMMVNPTTTTESSETLPPPPKKLRAPRGKRKSKRDPVVKKTSAITCNPSMPTMVQMVHPAYVQPIPPPSCQHHAPASGPFMVPPTHGTTVEQVFTKVEPPPSLPQCQYYHHHHHVAPHHTYHHYAVPPPCDVNIKQEFPSCSVRTHAQNPNQSAYKAFSNGRTLIEVYSPTVGRGFNPRYNSFLVEPTPAPWIPLITGQSPTSPPTDMEAFLHMAIEVHIPNQHTYDARLW